MATTSEQLTAQNDATRVVDTTSSPGTKVVEPSEAIKALQDENARLKQAETDLKAKEEKARGYVVALTQRLAATETHDTRVDPGDFEARRAALKELVDEDPEAAMDAHFQTRVAPIVQSQQKQMAVLNRTSAIQALGPEAWKRWGDKIDAFMANMGDDVRAQPGSYERAYKFVLSENLDEVINERVNAALESHKKSTLMEGSGAGSAAPGNGGPKPLSAMEKSMAAEFGMSEDEWRKFGNKNYNPNEDQA